VATANDQTKNFGNDASYSIRLIPLDKNCEGMKVKGSISLLSRNGSVAIKLTYYELVSPSDIYFDGHHQIFKLLDLQSKNLLVNDKLTLLCQFKVTDVAYSTSVKKKEGLPSYYGEPQSFADFSKSSLCNPTIFLTVLIVFFSY
jgi:hypothetical protein